MGSSAVAIANASDAIVPAVSEPSTTAMLVAFGCLVMFWRNPHYQVQDEPQPFQAGLCGGRNTGMPWRSNSGQPWPWMA